MIWDTETGDQLDALRHEGETPAEAHFSPDGKWVVTTTSESADAVVWNVETGKAVQIYCWGQPFGHNNVRADPF